ncbi:Tat pathway signal protein [Jannaschia sp. EhC01]|nr:Tat pathway signal protein [Jannaschia sp. EhC01]
MTQTRRQFIALSLANATAARLAPTLAARAGGKRVLTLVYDKGLGMMRAVDRIVP